MDFIPLLLNGETQLFDRCPKVGVAFAGVCQGVGLCRVLLGLADDPAAVAGLGDGAQCGFEIDAAVAGDRVDAVDNGIEEAPALGPGNPSTIKRGGRGLWW